MDNNTLVVPPEKPLHDSKEVPSPKNYIKFVIPVLIILVLILTGAVIYLLKRPSVSSIPATSTPSITKAVEPSIPTPSQTVTNDLLLYKNNVYGFEIAYPKNYKALDDKENLYGYPNGIVLIYAGGQAYDVVIEVWNTKAEYETAYGPRTADVTVQEVNGKFITLMDNTNEPENKQIIESFKLLQ